MCLDQNPVLAKSWSELNGEEYVEVTYMSISWVRGVLTGLA